MAIALADITVITRLFQQRNHVGSQPPTPAAFSEISYLSSAFLNHKHCSWSSFFIHCEGSYCILQRTVVAWLCCSTVRQMLAHRSRKAPLLRQPQRSLWDQTSLSYMTCTFRCCSCRSRGITGTPALTTTYPMAWHIAYLDCSLEMQQFQIFRQPHQECPITHSRPWWKRGSIARGKPQYLQYP